MTEPIEPATVPSEPLATVERPVIQKFCAGCGAPVPLDGLFCPGCGIAIARAESRSAVAGATQPIEAPDPLFPLESEEPDKAQAEDPCLPLLGPNAPTRPEPKACCCGRHLAKDAQFCDACGMRVGDISPEYHLVGINPELGNVAVRIADGDLTLGKADDCGLVLSHDEYASRRHARVFRSQGMLFLEDLGSSNGTFLRVRRPIVLEVGDEIAIGTSVLRLEESRRA